MGGVVAIAAVAVAAYVRDSRRFGDVDVLHALAVDPFQDTDGDLLPDALEWVALSDDGSVDTDADGRDDFLEAVQCTAMHAATGGQPVDQEMRVLLSCLPDRVTGERYVWMHCLFRFASGRLDLDWFMPFVSTSNGLAVSISDLFGRTPMRVSVRDHASEGLYAIATLRLARERDLVYMLPCMVNARAVVGGRYLTSSTYVFNNCGTISSFVPVGRDVARGVLLAQSLQPHDGTSNVFFSGNRVCAQTLVITGQIPGGVVCEVNTSSCQPANGLRCAADCPTRVGETLIAPDGPGAITGG